MIKTGLNNFLVHLKLCENNEAEIKSRVKCGKLCAESSVIVVSYSERSFRSCSNNRIKRITSPFQNEDQNDLVNKDCGCPLNLGNCSRQNCKNTVKVQTANATPQVNGVTFGKLCL